jgi:hypothetical protein
MDVMVKLEYLEREIVALQDRNARKREQDKREAIRLRVATVVFSGTITILLGLQVADQVSKILSNVALGLSALITVVSAVEAFYDYRGLWIRRTVLVARLSDLKTSLDFYKLGREKDEIDEEAVNGFLSMFQDIRAEDLRAWLQMRGVSGTPFQSQTHPPPTDGAAQGSSNAPERIHPD